MLGNGDDVPGASFQATIAVSFDAETAFLDVSIACSSDTINAVISTDRGSFVLHAECSTTLFRFAHRSRDSEFRVAIPKSELAGAVEVNVVAIADTDISSYNVEGQHSDYGNHTFSVGRGDLLAVGQGQQFVLDRDYASFQSIDSIISVAKFALTGDRPMEVIFEDDKIQIYLSQNDYAEYAKLRMGGLAAILASNIVLPVIVEALHYLVGNDAETDYRWARAVRKRVLDIGRTLDDEPLVLAQLILELPLKRALASAISTLDGD